MDGLCPLERRLEDPITFTRVDRGPGGQPGRFDLDQLFLGSIQCLRTCSSSAEMSPSDLTEVEAQMSVIGSHAISTGLDVADEAAELLHGNQTTLVFDHCPLQFDLPAGQLSGLLLQSNHLVGLRVQFAQFGLEAGDTGLGPSDPFGQSFPFGARLSRGGPIAVPLRHDPFPQPVVMVVLVSTSSRQVQCPPQ